MQDHADTHAKLECTLCKNLFISEQSLKQHLLTHSKKERPFTCEVWITHFIDNNSIHIMICLYHEFSCVRPPSCASTILALICAVDTHSSVLQSRVSCVIHVLWKKANSGRISAECTTKLNRSNAQCVIWRLRLPRFYATTRLGTLEPDTNIRAICATKSFIQQSI